jgi:hypothetical protein
MALTVLALAIPVGNGVGAASDAHLLDTQKSFVLDGTIGSSEQLVIESTCDPAGLVGWTGVVAWTSSNPGDITIRHVAYWYRVRRNSASATSSPTASVAATALGTNVFFAPTVPASGPGAGVDISTGGPNMSVTIDGTFGSNEVVALEGSQDNVSWNGIRAFTNSNPGPIFIDTSYKYLRANRTNLLGTPGGTIQMFVGTSSPPSGGGGAFPGFGGAPPAVASASAAGVGATASRFDHTHAQDLVVYAPSLAGMQATGVIQQTYGAPNATPAVLNVSTGLIPFGNAGLLAVEAAFAYNAGSNTLTVDSITSNAATDLSIAAPAGQRIQAGNTIVGSSARDLGLVGTPWRNIYSLDININGASGALNLSGVGAQGITKSTAGTLSIGTQLADNIDINYNTAAPPSQRFRAGANGVILYGTNNIDGLQTNGLGNVMLGRNQAMAAAAIDGFPFMPVVTAKPTGAASFPFTQAAPFVLETTSGGLWVKRNGGSGWEVIPIAQNIGPGVQALTLLAGPAGIVSVAAKYETYVDAAGITSYRPYWQ